VLLTGESGTLFLDEIGAQPLWRAGVERPVLVENACAGLCRRQRPDDLPCLPEHEVPGAGGSREVRGWTRECETVQVAPRVMPGSPGLLEDRGGTESRVLAARGPAPCSSPGRRDAARARGPHVARAGKNGTRCPGPTPAVRGRSPSRRRPRRRRGARARGGPRTRRRRAAHGRSTTRLQGPRWCRERGRCPARSAPRRRAR